MLCLYSGCFQRFVWFYFTSASPEPSLKAFKIFKLLFDQAPLTLWKQRRVTRPLPLPQRGRGAFVLERRGEGLLIFLSILLTACLPLSTPSPTPIPQTPTATLTPTPTTVWFPPTATFTPFPTSTSLPPTPDQRPGIGGLLFSDDFSDPAAWELINNPHGTALLGKNELTLAIQEEKAYVFSLRAAPDLADFYAEITASPSFCRGVDEYGVLFRFVSPATFYRFSLSCDGRVRLDRLSGGSASSPQAWLETGVVPIGAPSTSRLGIWAKSSEMRFFVGDQYLFTVQDPLIPSGRLGVFARSTGGHALTVNFSSLSVYEINP